MSRASKLALLGSSLFAAGTVVFVHWQQKSEKEVGQTDTTQSLKDYKKLTRALFAQAMHQGVVRDMEQQRIKRERQLDFDMQRELEAEYKKVQSVRESTSELAGGGPPGAGTGTVVGR